MKKKISAPQSVLALTAAAGTFFQAAGVCTARASLWGAAVCMMLLVPLLSRLTADGLHAARAEVLLPVILAASAVQELRQMGRFYSRVYPQQLAPWMFFLFVALAMGAFVCGRSGGFAAAASSLKLLLAATLLLLILSLAGQMETGRLVREWTLGWQTELSTAILLQCRFLPEYLLWPLLAGGKKAHPAKTAAVVVGLQSLFLILGELVVGQTASAWMAYSLSCMGQIAVFSRLDHFQVVVWSVLVLFKAAFYLYYARCSSPTWLFVLSVGIALAGLGIAEAGAQVLIQIALWLVFAAALGGSLVCERYKKRC